MKEKKYASGICGEDKAVAAELHIEIMDVICGYMEEHGITKADLAVTLNVPRSSITRWFSGGNLCLLTIARLCRGSGIKLGVKVIGGQSSVSVKNS